MPSSSSSSSLAAAKREIKVKDFGSFKQGDVVDLSDYVTIVPGSEESETEKLDLSFTYDILSDGAHLSTLTVEDSETPSLYPSKRLVCVRKGRSVLRLSSGEVSKIAYFDVEAGEEAKKIASFFDGGAFDSYTVSKAFSVGTNFSMVSDEESLTLVKTPNYVYYPSSQYGLEINAEDGNGYYYSLASLTSSPKLHLNGSYNTVVNLSSFKDSFIPLSTSFALDGLTYFPALNQVSNGKYSYCIPKTTATSSSFALTLSALSLTSTVSLNGYSFTRVGLVPEVCDDGSLKIYALDTNSSLGSLIEGPYVVKKVASDVIAGVNDLVNAPAPSPLDLAGNDYFMPYFSSITNYTVKTTGFYEDLEGNKIAVPDYFSTALPEISIEMKVTEDALESTSFNLIDGGEETHLAIVDEMMDGALLTNKYRVNDDGTYTYVSSYGKDPSSGVKVAGWQTSKTFSAYRPSALFSETAWKYSTYLHNADGSYSLSGFNDSSARGTIKNALACTSASGFATTSSPLGYYAALASMDFTIDTTKGAVGASLIFGLIDGDGKYLNYHYSFSLTSIGTTTVDVK